MESTGQLTRRILIQPNGPYRVEGGIPLVRKTQIVSEYGEPLTWRTDGLVKTRATYELCRCGQSAHKPFCDSSHERIPFDGTETADTSAHADHTVTLPGSRRITVKKDPTVCMESGFCGTRNASLPELVLLTDDTQVRTLIMGMCERCPSGALTYSIEPGGPVIEPDLPQQIADTTEITDDGPIAGPLWVTGYLPIVRADGREFAPRNRVTLCNCGLSHNKPLCDGAHREQAQRTARRRA